MFLVCTIYESDNKLQKTIWWGKGTHYIVQDRFDYPQSKWVEDFGLFNEVYAKKRIDKIPDKMFLDGRVYTATRHTIYSHNLVHWKPIELIIKCL